MITERDIQEAIAECQGERNPNAQTCIKLAAYYTILNELERKEPQQPAVPMYSYSQPPEQPENTRSVIDYKSGSEFSEAVDGQDTERVMEIIDELMEAVFAIQPRLYDATLRKLNE